MQKMFLAIEKKQTNKSGVLVRTAMKFKLVFQTDK